MIFEGGPAPVVIGHRGMGSGPLPVPENTIASLLATVEAGLSWVEVDVQRTGDDELVLRHDPTTADGRFVIDRTADELGLPRLAEVFDALPPGVGVDVDVKTILEDAVDAPSRRTGALLLPLLAAEARRRPLLVTSFDPAMLAQFREELPGVPLGLLTWTRFPMGQAVAAAAGLGLQAVALDTGSFKLNGAGGEAHRPAAHSVEAARKAGLEVLAWCPKPEEVTAYRDAGVDAVIVDDIPGTLAALRH
ncbi:MAG: glycerophosphoryl diester phosphodiesterase [Actinomycetia bacterium]|nr:glycerophosphoryl diester phosphodiesterase [Actinomycetes bacterium]